MKVVFDLDGTLVDVSKREHLLNVDAATRDWDAFHQAGLAAECIQEIATLARICHSDGHEVIVCTGRPDNFRDATQDQLAENRIPVSELLMRPAGDHRKDVDLKWALVQHIPASEILFIVEDRDQVVDMWRDKGFVCLQCRRTTY